MALSLPTGLRILDNSPVDNRTRYQTIEEVLTTLNTARRYVGLKIFIISLGKEYWFRDGITNADFIEYAPSSSTPSDPVNCPLRVVSTVEERDAIPLSQRFEGLEVNVAKDGVMSKYVLLGGLTNDDWVEIDLKDTGGEWEILN